MIEILMSASQSDVFFLLNSDPRGQIKIFSVSTHTNMSSNFVYRIGRPLRVSISDRNSEMNCISPRQAGRATRPAMFGFKLVETEEMLTMWHTSRSDVAPLPPGHDDCPVTTFESVTNPIGSNDVFTTNPFTNSFGRAAA